MVKKKIRKLLKQLNKNVYEKENILSLALLSSIAGESIFLLGPPGVAKSLVARKLKHAYKNSKSFDYLMSRFSTPDEIFGPVSIKKLKDEDSYERLTEKYLPGAQIVFLDEIWKAGPPIQNALLTVLNEKIYRNGEEEIHLDLRGIISASNELPAEGEGLEALWDRFLIRLLVLGIEDEKVFETMITDTEDIYQDKISEECKITKEEYQEWNKFIHKVEVAPEVLCIISVIRKKISIRNEDKEQENKIIISDRRWKKIVRLLRTSAFLNNRERVDLMDCFLIPHCIWSKPEEIEELHKITENAIKENGYIVKLDIGLLKEMAIDLSKDVQNETKYQKEEKYKTQKIYTNSSSEKFFKFVIEQQENQNYPSYSRGMFRNNFKEFFIKIQHFEEVRKQGHYPNRIECFYELDNSHHRGYSNRLYVEKIRKNKIYANQQSYIFELETKTKMIEEVRKPHSAVRITWDKTVNKVLESCQSLENEIDLYKKRDLRHIQDNLFVPSACSKHVLHNLSMLLKETKKIKVEIEKVRHYYESL